MFLWPLKNIRFISVFVFLFILLFTVWSQSSLYGQEDGDYWIVVYDSRYEDSFDDTIEKALFIDVDGNGDIAVAGYYEIHAKESRAIAIKLNSSGDLLWEAEYASDYFEDSEDNRVWPRAMKTDLEGNVFITGWTKLPSHDFFTIKYDSNGNLEWENFYGEDEVEDEPFDLAVDDQGNAYVAGKCPGNGYDYRTLKYNAQGDLVWEVTYDAGGNSDFIHAIAVDESGNVFVTGEAHIFETDSYNIATVKYNSDGEEQWVATYDNNGIGASGYKLAIDSQANILAAGFSKTGGDKSSTTCAVVKYNQNGDLQWNNNTVCSLGFEEYGIYLATDSQDNVYLGSITSGEISSYEFTVAKYDTEGNEEWIRLYSGGQHCTMTDMAIDDNGNVVITGNANYNDFWFSVTLIYDTDGELKQEILIPHLESPSPGSDHIQILNDLTFDSNGNLYAAASNGWDFLVVKNLQYIPEDELENDDDNDDTSDDGNNDVSDDDNDDDSGACGC